jgi:Gylcosyl hydrolase family 115 C-terminal domain
LGIAVEGSEAAWPGASGEPPPLQFDVSNQQRRYFDVFNRGQTAFEFAAASSDRWIVLSATHGTLGKDQRILVSVNWDKAPKGSSEGSVKLVGAGTNALVVKVRVFNPEEPPKASLKGFVAADGYVSIEAEHYTKKTYAGDVSWEKLDDYGRTLSSMTIFPVTAQSVTPPQNSPCLEYQMYVFNPGAVQVEAILAPTLNFVPGRGLRYAISFDDQPPQIIDALAKNSVTDWATSVKDSVRKSESTHTLANAGYHTLKFWMVDPGLALQKLVVNLGGVKPSYFGPPESYRVAAEP